MINKELLERYHLGQCTKDERDAVEEWLDNDDLEISGNIDISNNLNETKATIWDEVQCDIKNKNSRFLHLKQFLSATAAALLCLLGLSTFLLHDQLPEEFTFDNLSGDQIQNFEEHNYNITLSKKSFARIDTETGELDLKGDIMFTPKKDLTLLICDSNHQIRLKSGETYILMAQKQNCEHVVLTKQELTFLSPILQNQLKIQFNIS